MTLSEATYLVRLLTKRRLPSGIVADLDVNPVEYRVMVRLDPDSKLELTRLAVALWLIGYSCTLEGAGILTFEASPKLLLSGDEPVDSSVVEDSIPPTDPRWQQVAWHGYGPTGSL